MIIQEGNKKHCINCGQYKSLDNFYKRATGSENYKRQDLYDSYCKECKGKSIRNQHLTPGRIEELKNFFKPWECNNMFLFREYFKKKCISCAANIEKKDEIAQWEWYYLRGNYCQKCCNKATTNSKKMHSQDELKKLLFASV